MADPNLYSRPSIDENEMVDNYHNIYTQQTNPSDQMGIQSSTTPQANVNNNPELTTNGVCKKFIHGKCKNGTCCPHPHDKSKIKACEKF